MARSPREKRKAVPRSIHPTIKRRLGYDGHQSDAEVLKDWRSRLKRVCKPCWELKYCPYGPFVEQSPLLPSERAGVVEHNNYLQNCLDIGQIGTNEPLSSERRAYLEEWLNDDDILAWQVQHELAEERRTAHIAASKDPGEAFESAFSPDLPPIEQYRISYDVLPDRFDWSAMTKAEKAEWKRKIKERKKEIRMILKNGVEDTRKPLDPGRRAYFEKSIKSFNAEDYPEEVPPIFRDGECNIFGHICPVFFTAEAMTETSTARRRGRHIPFAVRMRVVRRDNYTCQHCGISSQRSSCGIRPQNTHCKGWKL